MAVAMASCSSQKRAQRHIRRAVELCPELAQLTARPIDVFLGVPVFTDSAIVPLMDILDGDTLTVKTDHGTITLSANSADSTLSASFTSDESEIHYQDTVQYRQIDFSKSEQKPSTTQSTGVGRDILLWIIGVGFGMVLVVWIRSEIKNRIRD